MHGDYGADSRLLPIMILNKTNEIEVTRMVDSLIKIIKSTSYDYQDSCVMFLCRLTIVNRSNIK